MRWDKERCWGKETERKRHEVAQKCVKVCVLCSACVILCVNKVNIIFHFAGGVPGTSDVRRVNTRHARDVVSSRIDSNWIVFEHILTLEASPTT